MTLMLAGSVSVLGAIVAALVVMAGTGAASAATAPAVQVAAQPTTPDGAAAEGALPASTSISGAIGLKPRDAAGLSSYAAAVGTPGSATYHDYLSLAQFNAAYAPSAATVSAVEAELKAGGLSVSSVSADNLVVDFSGTAGNVASTFHTALERYRLKSGRDTFANTEPAALSASVAPSVETVVGLNGFVVPQPIAPTEAPKHHTLAPASSVTIPSGAAKPCAAVSTVATESDGLTADQVAHAYGLDPLYSSGDFGAGQKVDILDLFGYNLSDNVAFDNCYYGSTVGPQVTARLSSTNVDGGAQTDPGTGNTVETEIDTEAVAAYAPQASVDVFEAPNTVAGLLDDVAAMTNDTASRIESISYGSCEQETLAEEPGYVQLENSLFEQAAVEGKTVFAASGDNGSDTCSNDSGGPGAPLLSDSDPASQPYVTAVGGTAITAPNDPPSEEVWNDGSAGGAAGGGVSDIWEEPSWQTDSRVPGTNNASIIAQAEQVDGNDFCQTGTSYTEPCREVPDVSAQASPNTGGFPLYTDNQWLTYGGTSLSSPTWAAILADINSTPSCTNGGGAGFISPSLYSIASVPSEYAASFNDITLGDNDNFGAANGLYPATTGYDMASGLGSPKVTGANGANGLAYYLCAPAAATAPKVSTVTPSSLSSTAIGKGASLTVYGAGFELKGVPDVAGATIGVVQVPKADITVKGPGQLVIDPVPATVGQTGAGGVGSGDGTYPVEISLTGGQSSAPGPRSTLVVYPGSSTSGTPQVDGTEPSGGVESGGNTVTVYGAGFAQSPITSVTFGGVPAQSYSVINDNEISVVTPVYSKNMKCASSDTPSIGTCQVQVKVTTTAGSSPEPAIPAEYSGEIVDASAPGDYPAPNEFDYEPVPHIASITYGSGPDLASEAGGTVVTINGTGLGAYGLQWVNVGPYQSDNSDIQTLSVSTTALTLVLPAQAPTNDVFNVPVTVQTYGSPNQAPGVTLTSTPPSNTLNVAYAPTPTVTGVSAATTGGILAGPTSGGTPITLTGEGFTGAQEIKFVDAKYGFVSTQYGFNVVSNTEITLKAPSALASIDGIEVCGVSGCSAPSSQVFTFYVPGNPSVSSITPVKGSKGTQVTITGQHLGFVQNVYFGSAKATGVANAPGALEDGNTTAVVATAPAGTSGKTVDIRVTTLESEATGYGESPVNPSVTFTYAK